MIYLDSSALVTITVERLHARELRAFLGEHATAKTATSTIGLIETIRTCDRLGSYPYLMARLLREHTEIKVTAEIRDAAAHVPGALRSLDAVHVASAQKLGSELISLVTYDKRMADAARAVGLPVATPGIE